MLLLKQSVRDGSQVARMSGRLFSSSSVRHGERETDKRRNFDAQTILDDEKKGVFRVLQIGKPKDGGKRQLKRRGGAMIPPPQRADRMKPDQKWGDVWPAARTFHPAVVPLPVRQGVVHQKAQVVPSKHANAELMKIPNFLHLSPPVVKMHCAALAQFCTPWPQGLDTEEDIEAHFPLTLTYSDYLNSSSSIRDRRSRIVQIKINIKSLPLDDHAKDKLIRLVGDRYNEETGEILLVSDRCPYRGQNEDYCKYLLTALLHESWRVEDWEVKGVMDKEMFVSQEELGAGERQALQTLLNQGETEVTVANYREEVRKMLGLPETIKKKMAQFDASEAGLRNFKDFLSIYNQMSEMCFNRCVINLNHRQLSEEEQVCSDVCAEKQMKYNNRIMGVYVVEQPIATERKMKEAEEQANTVMNKLKEQGIDVDNLSQEDLMQEALKLNANR